MSLQDKISADQAAVTAAQAALDAANAALTADNAALAALQPHLANWDLVATFAETMTDESIKTQLLAFVAAGKAALEA